MANALLIRASDGTGNAATATVQTTRAPLATTQHVNTVDNMPSYFIGSMGTPHTFVDPVTGETITVISEATCVDFAGHVDGANIEIDTIAPGYTDHGSAVGDIIIIRPTTYWADNLTDWARTQHTDAGAHKSLTTDTVAATGVISAQRFAQTGKAGMIGWTYGLPVPNTIVNNGQRSYTLTFNATDLRDQLTPKMRMRMMRTTAAPVQCTSLSGSQWFSKTTPAGQTFTDDFAVAIWAKPTAYANGILMSRYNGTSGWHLFIASDGRIHLGGFNGGGANYSEVISVQSHPITKWTHIAAQLDMSAFTPTTTTSYIMIDGVDVPCTVARGGTNPTALVQAGNFEIGGENGGTTPYTGKLSVAALFSAKVTQATMRDYMNATFVGTETSLASAYSFNNSITDLNTTNANNLTANGSAVATNADSPFAVGSEAVGGSGYTAGTAEYGIIQSVSFSTNTTVVVQVPVGCAIPTREALASIFYSIMDEPYGFPAAPWRWRISTILLTSNSSSSNANYGAFIGGGFVLTAPIGEWNVGWHAGDIFTNSTTQVVFNISSTSLVGLSSAAGRLISPYSSAILSPSAAYVVQSVHHDMPQSHAAQTTYVMYTVGSTTGAGLDGSQSFVEMFASCGLL